MLIESRGVACSTWIDGEELWNCSDLRAEAGLQNFQEAVDAQWLRSFGLRLMDIWIFKSNLQAWPAAHVVMAEAKFQKRP